MSLHRRSLLRGLFQGSAVAMALPLLDCFLDGHGEALADGRPIPVRFGTFFWGCGLTRQLFLPRSTGAAYEDMPQLAALKPFKAKMNLLSGYRAYLDSRPNIQHWSGNAAIATGIAPGGDGQFDAPTLDQIIAGQIGKGSRFRSIEIACSGNKRESYSSSTGGANVNPPEVSPSGLYTRLFGPGFNDGKGEWKPDPSLMMQQSVLSVVAEDRQRLMASAGAADKARLDQYFSSVRELENTMTVELQKPEIIANVTVPEAPPEMTVNKSVPVLKQTVPVFSKLLAIGLATNQSRIFNMALTEPANTMFMPGDSHVFHQATHEEPVDPALGYQPVTSQFSTHSMECFADLVAALDAITEGTGTVLDHSLVLAYTDTSNAKLHAIDGIPMFTAGSANGKVRCGLHIAGNSETVSRVGLTMQQAMGLAVDSWGAESNRTNKPISELLV
ncbi:MAG: DUF1552 domain-containing protein [Alphaproteobacteria bacterium]|nr:DUF1552 domain-containing protein [Alphaproteobacteria bacterium]